MFKQDADYPFIDWSFSGSTQEEFTTLMRIFDQEGAEVYIANYQDLAVYAYRIIVPGMSRQKTCCWPTTAWVHTCAIPC